MKYYLALICLLSALSTRAADFVGSVAASNSTGRLVAPTNFFFGNLFAGSNVYLEKTNRTGYRIHVTPSTGVNFSDLVWTNDVGDIYIRIDRDRISFYTNMMLGRYMRIDGTNTAFGSNALPATFGDVNSTAFGQQALSVHGVDGSSAFGHRALASNDSGAFNTAVGAFALEANQFRSDNTAIGYGALQFFITGFEDTAVGSDAMGQVTDSYYGTALGYGAMDKLNGLRNTALGASALSGAIGGGNDILAIGFESMRNSDRPEGVIAIGSDTLFGIDDLTNLVVIGHQATAIAGFLTNSVGLGANTRITSNNQMMLGTNIINYVLRNVGYNFPSSQGAASTTLTNDGTGNLGWLSLLIFQPASANLTNWSNIPTGAMANAVAATFLTNWANAVSNYVTAATNSASVTNWIGSRQPASGNLTNWSLYSTNTWNDRQGGSLVLSNIVGTGALTNANAFQPANAILTNLTGTGALTNANLFQPANANLTNWALYSTNVWNDRQGGSIVLSNIVGTGAITNRSDIPWTNDTVAIKPNAFPTNVILRTDVPDDGVGTNYYWDARTYRANAASKLFALYNGGSNALTVGGFGGIFIGRNNPMPGSAYVFQAQRDTVLGEPADAWIGWSASHSGVGYSGSGLFGTTTNASTFGLTANDGNVKLSFLEVDTYFTNALLKLQYSDATSTRGMVLSPGFNGTPTNYLFKSAFRLTNIHTLLSLQNSNTPVFEVDGIGDLKLLKRVAYSWPSSQGASQTMLTNDGSGNLGWFNFLTFQPASANLTNWSNIPTGAMANVVATDFLTNWANAVSNLTQTKQFGSDTLTNLSGTRAVTNLFAPSVSNATIKPVVFGGVGNAAGMTNLTGQIYGLEAGGNVVLTPNGSNITVQATLTGGGYATNANQFGAQVTLTLKDGISLSNIVAFPTGAGTAPALTVTNIPGMATNSFQVLNTNGVPVIFGLTNNGITLVASNVNFLGPQTNTSALNVLGGVTNWAAVETRGNATNAGWLNIAGGVTNFSTVETRGNATNAGWLSIAGGETNWAPAEVKGTLYASSNLLVKVGQSGSNAWVGGTVFVDATTATTNHTGTANYTNLFTFTVPGNALTNIGDELEFYLSGTFKLATATTNGFKCIYGTATIFDTGFITASNCPWKSRIKMTRTGNATQRVESEVLWMAPAAGTPGVGAVTTYATNMPFAQNNGITNIFAFQGQSRVAAVITNDYRSVKWIPAPN